VSPLAAYEALRAESDAMLRAARAGDWDAAAAAERRCAAVGAALEARGAAQLPEAARAQQRELIRQVLANHAEVRRLALPRRRELEEQLAGSRNARRLGRAYGIAP
jgi:hypothetical protein